MGTPTATSFGVTTTMVPPQDDYSARSGVASLGMKAQVWWIQNNGFDGKSGKVNDGRRRESRRRGEDLFRHDVDTFELTCRNLIGAPGCRAKKIRRGRGKYGTHGRACGYGQKGAKTRGRGTINRGYEGGGVPIQIRIPKLTEEQKASVAKSIYTSIELSTLNMCSDGDEVDWLALFVRGFPVGTKKRHKHAGRDWFKVVGKDKDEFTVKNLTVYAHAFDPSAQEKIEENGGRCVRLHDRSNLPLDEGAIKTLIEEDDEESGAESAEE